jgi:hypothetical protein
LPLRHHFVFDGEAFNLHFDILACMRVYTAFNFLLQLSGNPMFFNKKQIPLQLHKTATSSIAASICAARLLCVHDRLMFEMFGYPQSPVRQGGEQSCH